MKVGIADYGMSVWDGGNFDPEQRWLALKQIGYDGIERIYATSEADLVQQAALMRRHGFAFTTVRGPDVRNGIAWTAAMGKDYVWVQVTANDLPSFCRQAEIQAAACARYGIRAGLHNHLGSPVESQAQLEEFLACCPHCGLILDTGHLAAAGGDCAAIIRRYADRLLVVHVKDWFVTNPEIGLAQWYKRGRFCELGAGNINLDHGPIIAALRQAGYDGWVFVEHDTHLREPLTDLTTSRQYLRRAGC